MDAKKTGALIAERRKTLGLTQKELAGRLIVSDKAVSKWETGAGYPEVTMLPLLAETLGITVDELLAGEVRADAPAPEQAAPQPSDIQRAYAAEKLADADDKLLLGGIILLLPLVYWVQVFAYLSAYGLLVTMLCIALFCACFGWHSKKRTRLAALCQTDTERSRRRCRLLGVLFGGISVAALLRSILGYCMLHGIYPYYGKIAAAGSRRFDVFIRNMRTYDYHSVEAVLLYLYPLLSIALFSLLIVAAVLAYRRMEAGTRFHPGLCGVPTLLAWGIAAAMLVYRFRIIARLEQLDYGIPLFEIQTPLEEQSNQLFIRFAVVWAAVVLAVVLLAVLLRRCTGAGSGAAVLCMVMQMPLWYFAVASNYLMEVDVTASYTDLYARGTITLYPNEFAGTLLLSLLIWAICTLLSGVRRKPRPSVAAQ